MNPSHSINQPNLFYYRSPQKREPREVTADICIYGGNSGGVIAGIAARRNGYSVLILEPGRRLGGLTAGGLGFTDIGNKFAIGGLSREFYRRVGRHYEQPENWRFEPHVAEKVFQDWLAEWAIPCHFESFLDTVEMNGTRINSITMENGLQVRARQFIDASYEGDLMARAKVSHTIGREGAEVYGEKYNGAQVMWGHQFDHDVDPYVISGDPNSGLLPGIDPDRYEKGKGDRRIQAYNFRLCLTDNPLNRLPITKPDDYDRADYELLVRYCEKGYVPEFSKFDPLINGKVDMNNHGAVSTDYIGRNHAFPEAGYAEREKIFQQHVRWVKGLLWFWANDPIVAPRFQEKFRNWGWTRDEFVETGGFSPVLYVREARRLVSEIVMTEHHCTGHETVPDPIALAAYTMDSHNCRRIVVDGKVRNEGDVQVHSGPPYPISFRAIVPQKGECENLLIPFCLSASHIAFGSIRMEPVFMILAESAVEAACLAIESECSIQDIAYQELRARLVRVGQVLTPVRPVNDIQAGE